MKLMRLGEPGRERPFLALEDGRVLDVSEVTPDFTPEFFASDGLSRLREVAAQRAGEAIPMPAGVRVGAPFARPGKIICIGLNYADHAAETGAAVPAEPIVFMKGGNCLVGPYDDLRIPPGSTKTDYEVELGVLIGRQARYLDDQADPLNYIAGYVACDDVSEREYQLERGGTWDKGKNFETFNPAGPYLVTADEVGDPGDLELWLDVNGERRQHSSTKNLVFGIARLVREISQFMVLEPGDLINTGTPGGVALATGKPEHYLKAGDVVELGISGLGSQKTTCVPAP